MWAERAAAQADVGTGRGCVRVRSLPPWADDLGVILELSGNPLLDMIDAADMNKQNEKDTTNTTEASIHDWRI